MFTKFNNFSFRYLNINMKMLNTLKNLRKIKHKELVKIAKIYKKKRNIAVLENSHNQENISKWIYNIFKSHQISRMGIYFITKGKFNEKFVWFTLIDDFFLFIISRMKNLRGRKLLRCCKKLSETRDKYLAEI